MKYTLLILLLAWPGAIGLTAYAEHTHEDRIDTNKGLQDCLDDLKYAYEDFDTFDWNKAAACHSKIVTEKVEAERFTTQEAVNYFKTTAIQIEIIKI